MPFTDRLSSSALWVSGWLQSDLNSSLSLNSSGPSPSPPPVGSPVFPLGVAGTGVAEMLVSLHKIINDEAVLAVNRLYELIVYLKDIKA